MPRDPSSRKSLGPRLRALLPWAVGLILLCWVLAPYAHKDTRQKLVTAFSRAPLWAPAVAVVGALAAYLADTFATWCVLSWAQVRLRFHEVAVMRGATYFFAIVNYTMGQAAMVWVLARHGVRAMRAAGIVLFIMGINLIVLLAFAGMGLAMGARADPLLTAVIVALIVALPVYFLVIRLRPPILARRAVLAPLFDLGFLNYARAALVRLPHVACMLLSQWITMRAFGVNVPMLTAVIYLPLVFFVAVLPISAQGIGTSQVIAVLLFAKYAPGDELAQKAAVIAASVYLLALWVPTQAMIGALCVRTEFGRAMRAGAADPAPAAALD